MKINIGVAGIPIISKGRSTADGIKCIAELGLQSMEVEFVRGVGMRIQTAKKVGKLAKKLGIELSVHCPYYTNMCSPDRRKVEASKKRVLDSCERAAAMGAKIAVFHPGYYVGQSSESAFERMIDSCKDLTEKLKDKTINVKLGLETTGKSGAFGTLDEIVAVCKKVRRCVPVIDFAHLYARANGEINYKKVLDALKPLRLKHLHTHFSNIEFSSKGERRHLVIDNQPPFEPLASEILKRRQNITIICESPILEQDSLRMKNVFERFGHNFE